MRYKKVRQTRSEVAMNSMVTTSHPQLGHSVTMTQIVFLLVAAFSPVQDAAASHWTAQQHLHTTHTQMIRNGGSIHTQLSPYRCTSSVKNSTTTVFTTREALRPFIPTLTVLLSCTYTNNSPPVLHTSGVLFSGSSVVVGVALIGHARGRL